MTARIRIQFGFENNCKRLIFAQVSAVFPLRMLHPPFHVFRSCYAHHGTQKQRKQKLFIKASAPAVGAVCILTTQLLRCQTLVGLVGVLLSSLESVRCSDSGAATPAYAF